MSMTTKIRPFEFIDSDRYLEEKADSALAPEDLIEGRAYTARLLLPYYAILGYTEAENFAGDFSVVVRSIRHITRRSSAGHELPYTRVTLLPKATSLRSNANAEHHALDSEGALYRSRRMYFFDSLNRDAGYLHSAIDGGSFFESEQPDPVLMA